MAQRLEIHFSLEVKRSSDGHWTAEERSRHHRDLVIGSVFAGRRVSGLPFEPVSLEEEGVG